MKYSNPVSISIIQWSTCRLYTWPGSIDHCQQSSLYFNSVCLWWNEIYGGSQYILEHGAGFSDPYLAITRSYSDLQTLFRFNLKHIDHDSNLLVVFEGLRMLRSHLRTGFTSGYPPT